MGIGDGGSSFATGVEEGIAGSADSAAFAMSSCSRLVRSEWLDEKKVSGIVGLPTRGRVLRAEDSAREEEAVVDEAVVDVASRSRLRVHTTSPLLFRITGSPGGEESSGGVGFAGAVPLIAGAPT